MSVMAKTTMRFGAIIVCFFVMVIINILSSSSCSQLLKTKCELERAIAKLEDSRMRESTRWEGMLTHEKIERALLSNGLSMMPPKHNQVIWMQDDGNPRPGQPSVVAARQRNGLGSLGGLPGSVRAPSPRAPSRQKYRR